MFIENVTKFIKKATPSPYGYLISFCMGFAACILLIVVFHRLTTSRFKTIKELHLHSSKTQNVIVIPAGVELIQTEKIDDYLFGDDTYYLSIGLYSDDVAPAYKLGFREVWLHSKMRDQSQ